MGHLNQRANLELFDREKVTGEKLTDRFEENCRECKLGKAAEADHDKVAERIPEKIGEIVSACQFSPFVVNQFCHGS